MENRIILRFLLGALIFITQVMKGQLSGSVSVPGTYASLSAALVDINAQGVNGALTVAIQAGYTETVSSGGFSLTATGTSLAPITFIKDGAGVNPLLISYTGGTGTPGTAVQDGIWRFVGSDYITVDGIDLQDQNTNNPSTMEYGYGFFKPNAGNGCQYNVIRNCTITLRTINNATGLATASDGSRGINMVNALPNLQTTNISPFSPNASNSYNRFYNNVIRDCNIGIALIGFVAPSPFTFADIGNEIGGLLASEGNTISNFGGGTGASNPAAAIRTLAQYSLNIAGNYINNNTGTGTNHPSALRGIFLNAAVSADASVLNNTITLRGGSASQTLAAIENLSGSGGGSSFTARGNLITAISNTVGGTGPFYGIYNNLASVSTLILSDNIFQDITSTSSSGNVALIHNNAAISGASTFTNNAFSQITHTSTSTGGFYGIWNAGAIAGELLMSVNSFSGCLFSFVNGAVNPIQNTGAASSQIRMDQNAFQSFTATASNSGTLALVYNNAAASPTLSQSSNTIQNCFFNNNSGAFHLLYNRGALTTTFNTVTMDNNLLSSLTQSSTSNGGIFSIWNNGITSTLVSVRSNSVMNCSWQSSSNLRYVISHAGVGSNVQLSNNLITACTGTATSGATHFIYANNPNNVSSGTLAINNNTLSNLNFLSSTGDQYYIHNGGVSSNTYAAVQMHFNSLTNNYATITAAGGHYGIYNNAASASDLSIQNNTLAASVYSLSTGPFIHIYNRAQAGTVNNLASIRLNAIRNNTYSASGNSNIQLLVNSGIATSTFNLLQISSNTLSTLLFNSSTAAFTGILNNAVVTGTMAVDLNLVTSITHTQNQSATLINIQNSGSVAGQLSISDNTITANSSIATTGARYGIYNTAAASVSGRINNNLFSANTHSVSSSPILAYIFNSVTSSGSFQMTSNTISACSSTLQNGATYLIYNSSAITNTFADLRMEMNSVNTLTTLASTGALYGIFNNLCTSTLVSIRANTLTNLSTHGLTNTKLLIMNSGITTNSLGISANLLSSSSLTQNTSGSIYGIYNTGNAAIFSAQDNTLSTLQFGASTGSVFGIFNAALVTSTLDLSRNTLAQLSSSASAAGYFAGIQNAGVVSGTLTINDNSVQSTSLVTTSGSSHLICNRGAVNATINVAVISGNVLGGINHSSTTGSFSAIFNNNFICNSLSINANSLTGIAVTGSASPRAFLFNSGNSNLNISIINNLLSQNSFTILPANLAVLLLNTGNSSSTMTIAGNQILSNNITSSLAAVSLLQNSGAASQSLGITFNAITQNTINITGDAVASLLMNTSASGNTLSLNNNTVAACIIASSSSVNVILNRRSGASSSARFELSDNQLTSNTVQCNGGVLTLLGNADLTSVRCDLSRNFIQNNTLSGTGGFIYGIQNRAGTNQTVTLNSNSFSFNTINGSSSFFAIQETGTTSLSSISSNSLTSNVYGGSVSPYLLSNLAQVGGDLELLQNSISSNSQTSTSGGQFCAILNTGAVAGSGRINANVFSANTSAAFSSSVGLIYNAGIVNGLLEINTNSLSQSFSTTTNGFAGDLKVITIESGASTGSLAVSQNTFSNFNFNGGATGNLFYINNADNPISTLISANLWSNLILNHSGQHQFIYNDAVQGLVSVLSNTLSGYQITGAPGTVKVYSDAGTLSGTGRQLIDNNIFSSISSSITGFGSFYGISSRNAVASKTITSNRINAISLSCNGFMYLISADYLNDDNGTTASVIASNTLGTIFWQGPFYGIDAGPNLGTVLPLHIRDNSVITVTAAAGITGVSGLAVTSTSAGALVYRNKIADIQEVSSIGTVMGMRLINNAYIRAFNNQIGDLRSPGSLLAESETGIKTEGTGLTEIFYNTVYLAGTSTGSNSGSNALYSAGTGTLDLRNNILVNLRQSSGTGISAALRHSAGNLSGLSLSNDHNLLYAGIPSASRVVFANSTAVYPLFPAYQNLATPRELNSVSEAPVFQSTISTSSVFLHIDPLVSGLAESAAQSIASISTDIDLDNRQGSVAYIGTGTGPDIGADEFETALVPCGSAVAGTIAAAGGSLTCAGTVMYLYATGFSTNGNITYQWKSSTSATGPFSNFVSTSSATRPVLITPTLSSGTYYFVFEVTCSNGPGVSTSAVYTLQVNAMPGATAVANPSTVCAASTVTLNGISASGSTLIWSGPGSYSSTSALSLLTNINAAASGVYTLVSTLGGCSSSATTTLSVAIAPPAFVLSPSSASVCSGFTQQVQSNIPINTPTLTAGTQAAQNTSGTYPAPYSMYYGGQKMQFMVRASELSAAGFTTGTPLTDIRFPVVSLGSGWGPQVQACQNFQVSVKATTLTSLTQMQSNLTVLVPALNYTPVIGYNNAHVFTVPFAWDGSSNLVFETIFSNNLVGSGALSVIQNLHNSGFNSSVIYRADNVSMTALAAVTGTNLNLNFLRPDFKLNGQSVGVYSWTPGNFLNANNGSGAIITPTVSTMYTVTLNNGNCSITNTVNIEVFTVPVVTVAASSTSVCAGNTGTLTASGASNYLWNNGITTSTLLVNALSASNFTVQGFNGFCPAGITVYSITALPALVVTVTASSNVICDGQTSVLTAGGAQTYTWQGGAVTASFAVSPSVSAIYTVTGASGAGCSASRTFTVRVNPLPVILVSGTSSTICPGQEVRLTGAGASSYTWFPDVKSGSQLTVFPQTSMVYTVSGRDLNGCVNSASIALTVSDCSGLKEQNASTSTLVYPNPYTNQISIVFSDFSFKTIKLFNSEGKEVLNSSTEQGRLEVMAGDLAKGLYLLQIYSISGVEVFRLSKN